MSGHRYQPFYCEENAWWMCQHPDLAGTERWVVFISNSAKQCMLVHQRAASGDVIVWDYHVITIARGEAGPMVWDLDTRLGMPVPLADYLRRTFPAVPEKLKPWFRVVDADTLVALLNTDRSHMRAPDGNWLQPPPPWPAPDAGRQPNLARFIDMRDDIAGEVMDLDGLARFFSL